MRNIFAMNNTYKETVFNYTKKEGMKAITVYAILLIIYALAGAANTYNWFLHKYFLIIFDFAALILSPLLLFLSKQSMKTIGITKRNLAKSILFGGILAIIFGTLNIVTSIYSGCEINKLPKLLLLLANFFIVSVSEEFVFRGYIQTRIYGLLKNRFLAITVVAIMFVLVHFPSRMFIYGQDFPAYISSNVFWIINLFFAHIIFNFVYEKYNNLYGSILLHWMSNFTNYIII